MKICFVLQRQFAYVGHAIAKSLKEKGVVDSFCGYVYIRSSLEFLKSQKDIHYTQLLLDEDIHKRYKNEPLDLNYLGQLEKDYGLPNLWPYIEVDRVIRRGQGIREYPHEKPMYSHEDMMRILQVKTKAILNFLEEEKPHCLIFSVIGDISTLFFYQAAKKLGIEVLFLISCRVKNRHTITKNYEGLNFIERTFNLLQGNEISLLEETKLAKNFLEEFRKKPRSHSHQDNPNTKPISRKKQFAFLRPDRFIISFYYLIKTFVDYFLNSYKDDLYTIKPWHHFEDHLRRKIRVFIGFDDLYDQPDFSENYAFFPLQLEPEMGTSLFSKFYTDQLWLIKQVARSLPLNFKLYVKEHPAMYGYRPRRFYKELKKIPCLKLIHPTVYGLDIIQNAKLITTLTGTAGWEGILLKKPAITFGDVFYNCLPMAKKCDSINELPFLIKNQLEKFNYDEKSLLNFLTAIFKESADFDLISIWEIEFGRKPDQHRKEFNAITELIASKIK